MNLQGEIEKAFGIKLEDLKPVAGGNSSGNFAITTMDGKRYFLKSVKPNRIEIAYRNLSVWNSPLVPRLAFDGKIFDFDGLKFFASEWAEGMPKFPENLFPAEIAALVRDYTALSEKMQPLIHGDMHCRNVLFTDYGSAISAIVDFEMMREGHPTEDLLRYFIHRYERVKPLKCKVRGRIIANLLQAIALSPYSREAWLKSFDLYVERKEAHRHHRGFMVFSPIARAWRSRGYAKIRERIAAL